MRTGLRFARSARIFVAGLAVVLSLSAFSLADATSAQHHQRRAKKPPTPPPPLPSGPTGPIQQVPLDSIKPVAPQVSYQNGQLTIVAPNSTLGDILRAVRKQTGAEIEVPEAQDRVVTHIGPGPARDVIAELLNGSRFNYVLLGSPQDANVLTRVVLVAKSGGENAVANAQPNPMEQQQPVYQQPGFVAQQPPPAEMSQDANDADASDDNADENADSAETDQPAATPEQNAVKTPQQMLQEMQQRQLQLQQQQQQTGQPPMPGRSPQQQPPDQQ